MILVLGYEKIYPKYLTRTSIRKNRVTKYYVIYEYDILRIHNLS